MRWLFACLVLLDEHLDGESMSSIRELARVGMKVAAWRWIRGVTDKEVTKDYIGDGGHAAASGAATGVSREGSHASVGNTNGDGNGHGHGHGSNGDAEGGGTVGVGWRFGSTTHLLQGEAGLEETLGRCWILIHAVVAGWAQRDLLDDLEHMFR